MGLLSKSLLLIVAAFFVHVFVMAQPKVEIYSQDADSKADISRAVAIAGQSGKHVFLQIGGNWCPWCIRFHKFVMEDPQLDSLVDANYVVVKVNFSKENENREVLASLGYPQRFGFPVFIFLDEKGNRIHTQDSGLLEEGKGYSREKVKNMFQMWSAEAIRVTSEKYKP